MRPVNLIPPEDRRGIRAPLRAGSMSYVIVGACAAILVAVLAMVLTQNSITKHENEIAELEVARDAATGRASALGPYAQFAALQEQRESTISSLAESRFDWERVLRELALVIPADVSLETLEASTAGESEVSAATDASSAPSLTMSGCAPKHDDVAAFVAALEDVDGVTRVGLENSTKDDAGTAAVTSGDTGSSSCSPAAATFQVRAVFDGVAIAAAVAPPVTPDAPVPAGSEAVPADTDSAAEQTGQAQNAANVVPGTAR